ncbi:MAG: hypothetical protein JJ975_15025 [Bacteroidia bacterium]|nr:hypothetical protein [Bacteroidia bacterium]
MNSIRNIILLVLLTTQISSCGIYKFNGVTIPPEIETVSVAFIENKATIVAPTLSPTLTDNLRNKFLTQTNLRLIEENGDFSIEGSVTDYTVSPVGAADNSTASKNRLQVTIQMTLVSEKAKNLEFSQRFTQFEDFDASTSLADVEADLIETISDNLAQEVFNKAALNW